jgi:hypothetical protein
MSVVAAAAVAVFALFNVGFWPPSVSNRDHVEARGSIEILVDSSHSPIADARRDLVGLTARAGVFARLMTGGDVVTQISKEAGIPARRIDVAGAEPPPGQVAGFEGESRQHAYGIAIAQVGELPILNVATRAPTVRGARALAAAAPSAIRRSVRSIQRQQGTPAGRRVQFRVLGPAQAELIDETTSKWAALLLFVAVLAIFLVLILGIPWLLMAWRAVGSDPELREPVHDEQRQDAEVAHQLALAVGNGAAAAGANGAAAAVENGAAAAGENGAGEKNEAGENGAIADHARESTPIGRGDR